MAELQCQQKEQEEASILRNQLRAMTWAAQAKDEAMKQMQKKLVEAEKRAMELQRCLDAAFAREKSLIEKLEAALVAEERLATDMACLESESLHQAMEMRALRAQIEEQRRSSEAESVSLKSEMGSLLRRAEAAEMAEERLAQQICQLEAELHQLLKAPPHTPCHARNDNLQPHAQEVVKADMPRHGQLEFPQQQGANVVVFLPQEIKQQKETNPKGSIEPQLALQEALLAFGVQLKLWSHASLGLRNPNRKLVAGETMISDV